MASFAGLAGDGPIVVPVKASVSTTQSKIVNAADAPINVAVGRYVPLSNPKGEPFLFELSDPSIASYVLVPAGGFFGGVPWNSTDGLTVGRNFEVPTFVVIISKPGNLDVRVYGNGAITESKDKDGKTVSVQAPPVKKQTVSIVAGDGKRDDKKDDGKKDDDKKPLIVGSKLLVVIEETADATSGRAVYWTDAALVQRMKDKGHVRRIADKDVMDGATNRPPADLVPYLERAKGKKLPQLFIVVKDGQDAGTLVYQGDLPASPAQLIKLLEEVGG